MQLINNETIEELYKENNKLYIQTIKSNKNGTHF